MNEDIKILLGATLNEATSIKDINTAIGKIQSKVESVKLNISVDNNALKTMNSFVKAIESQKRTTEDLNRVLREEKVITKELDGTIKESIRQHLKTGEILQREITRRQEKNKVVQQESVQIKNLTSDYNKLIREVERYDKAGKLIGKMQTFANGKGGARSISTDSLGNVIGYKDIENLQKFEKLQQQVTNTLNKMAQSGKYASSEMEKISRGINSASSIKQLDALKAKLNGLKMGDSLANDQAKLTRSLKALYDQGKVNEQFFKNFGKTINSTKNVSEIDKVAKALKRVEEYTKNVEQKTKLLNQAQQALKSPTTGMMDTIALKNMVTQLNQIVPSSKTASNQLAQLGTNMKQFNAESRQAGMGAIGFGNAMSTAMTKYPIWLAATSIFIGIPNVVGNAINVIIDLDSKLVSLQKVMSNDTNFDTVMSKATTSAEKFAQTISSVLDTYGEFAKQGYNEEELPLLSDAALVTANVGEMEAGKAAEYLTSTLVQYKLEAEDAMGVINRWNEVSNKNGTTVEKLAQAYSKTASIAKTWGLGMDELNGIIGTVTEATKQSGNEIG